MTNTADPTREYLLRSCNSDFSSRGGYVWPNTVGATCRPNRWSSTATCGDGLHGFVNAEGNSGLADWSESAQWIVFSADKADVVVIDNKKAKVAVARIEHVGQGGTGADRRRDCLRFMQDIGRAGPVAMGVVRDGGDRSTLTGGYGSTLTGGDRSTLTGGYGSTLTGGYGSTLTGGNDSTLTGGDRSTLTGGYDSTLTAGPNSILIFRWWDWANNCMRLAVANQKKLKPNIAYTVRDGKVVEK